MSDTWLPTCAIPLEGFRSRKAAQICAFFSVKAPGGGIEKLKLIKLVYLSERSFIGQHRVPMLFDELYSLPHGPICSSTLNGIDGVTDDAVWSEYIARNGNVVVGVKKFTRDDFDEISDAEIEVLDVIWHDLGHMTASQLRNYSHDNCAEYTDTERKRIPIAYSDILRALGMSDADEFDREIQDYRHMETVLS